MVNISKTIKDSGEDFACSFLPKNSELIFNFLDGVKRNNKEDAGTIEELSSIITSQEKAFLSLCLSQKTGKKYIDFLDFKYNLLPKNFKNKDKLVLLYILLYENNV